MPQRRRENIAQKGRRRRRTIFTLQVQLKGGAGSPSVGLTPQSIFFCSVCVVQELLLQELLSGFARRRS